MYGKSVSGREGVTDYAVLSNHATTWLLTRSVQFQDDFRAIVGGSDRNTVKRTVVLVFGFAPIDARAIQCRGAAC